MTGPDRWVWVDPAVALAAHDEQLAEHGGGVGIRDAGAFESAMAFGTPRRLPDISTTSAASMATSVPVPTARPTSASARAGASLMPSPT